MQYLTFDAIINYLLEHKIVLDKKGYLVWIWDPEGIKKLKKKGIILK